MEKWRSGVGQGGGGGGTTVSSTNPPPAPLDSTTPRTCGCVPHLSLVYQEEEEEEAVTVGRGPAWARRFPLLGPFWCVRNTHSTTIRRR